MPNTVREFLDELEPDHIKELMRDNPTEGEIYIAKARVRHAVQRIKALLKPGDLDSDIDDLDDDVAIPLFGIVGELNL